MRNKKTTWTQHQKSTSESLLAFTDATLVAKDSTSNCKETPESDQTTGVALVKINGMQAEYYWANITLEDSKGGIVRATTGLATSVCMTKNGQP